MALVFIEWDDTGDEVTYNPRQLVKAHAWDRPNSRFIQDDSAVWVRLTNPMLDAQATTEELLAVLRDIDNTVQE